MFTSLTIALSREYLTGFSKRKADRRRRFAEKMKKELKTERKRLQVELREKIKKSNRDVPEVAHLLDDEEVEEEKDEPNVYELPEATVTISSITDNQLRQENVFLGNNTVRILIFRIIYHNFRLKWFIILYYLKKICFSSVILLTQFK